MGLLVLLTSLRSVRSGGLFLKYPGNLRDLLSNFGGLFKSLKNYTLILSAKDRKWTG